MWGIVSFAAALALPVAIGNDVRNRPQHELDLEEMRIGR
jgi:hypothetical protein